MWLTGCTCSPRRTLQRTYWVGPSDPAGGQVNVISQYELFGKCLVILKLISRHFYCWSSSFYVILYHSRSFCFILPLCYVCSISQTIIYKSNCNKRQFRIWRLRLPSISWVVPSTMWSHFFLLFFQYLIKVRKFL